MTQHLSLTLPNFNFNDGTIFLNSLNVCPLFPIGTDFSLHLQWLVGAPTNSSSPNISIENHLRWYKSFVLATGLTLIQCFCPCAHYTPKISVLFMNLRAIRSHCKWVFIFNYLLCGNCFCITRAFSYKITHNNKKVKTKKYIYSIDMEISFTFLVLVWSSIFISLYI